jgi:hypothetical protein
LAHPARHREKKPENSNLRRSNVGSHQAKRLLGTSYNDHLGHGILLDLPKKLYLDWVRKAPEARAKMIVAWLPIADRNQDGSLAWHPTIREFVEEFGSASGVLNVISARLHPNSWSGSLVTYVEPLTPLMEEWLAHSGAEIRAWAGRQLAWIRRAIEEETRRDEELDVRYG